MSLRFPIARVAVLVFAATLIPACTGKKDNLPPELTAIAPASLSASNPRQLVIVARFNKALDPATVTAANFVLIDKNSAVVTTSVPVYNAVLNEVTMIPSIALGVTIAVGVDTTYQMNILTGLKGADGLNFNGAAWQFTVPASDDVSRAPFTGLASATPTAASTTQVDLTWTNVTDPDTHVLSYEIYMSPTPGGEDFLGAPLATTPAPATFPFVLGGLTTKTTYSFVVRARDTATNDTDVNIVERTVTTN